MFFGWLGGIVLLFWIFRGGALRLTPFTWAAAIVIGIAITLLIACAHVNSRNQRLWQATRHEPIRRRSWLRWLGVGRALTCPFCRDDLGADLCECPECEASYHPECAEELLACATLGCEGLGTRAPRAPSKAKPRVSLKDPSKEPAARP